VIWRRLALSEVNSEGFGRTLVRLRYAAATPLCSSVPLCFKTHASSTWALVGPHLRTAPAGRASSLGAGPGLHPGLVELALQAEIAEGIGSS
jgi:hypothetical protein